MALSADLVINTRPRGEEAYVATTGVVYYHGAYTMLDTATGKAVLATDAVNKLWLGLTCRTHPLTTCGISTIVDEVCVNTSGAILERVAVVGVTAVTNVGDLVFVTADDTLTLTPTASTKAVGVVIRWHTGTSTDVRLFTPAEYVGLI